MRRLSKIAGLLLLSILIIDAVYAQPLEQVHGINIEGIDRTQEITVLRELPFSVGAVWREGFAEVAERRLRNLGIFSKAVVTAPDENGNVTVYLKERWSLWVLPQVSRKDNGASSAAVAVDEYNLWGLNHHARMAYRRDTGSNFSALQGSSYEAAYDWRRVDDSKLNISVSGSSGRSLYDTYNQGIHSAQYLQTGRSATLLLSYALGDVPDEGWSVRGGFTASNATYRFISGTPQADVVGHRIRALLAGVSYSRMNDRITWLSGNAFDYSLSAAHKGLGSTVNSYSHTASWRDYYTFSGQNTFNVRLNGGLVTGNVLRSGLFDLGNRDGLRGYYPGELQGTHYLFGSLEGRFPIREDSNLQLVTFADLGKIGGRAGASVTRGLAVGAGGGFRWTLRWLARGTIRGDVAYGFATKKWRFYLGTGQAF
ncbi:Surface antigen variable number repeat-containing protein [Mariprofundus ferrinatatus]|uniref:Surface antigen variable number repeat-containing protein n=1 Tax=Mariprofundus ferrinatatus TaxID=1921087 RepID=A0A2K8LFQ3_9PROT|nr:BamA/TamA family outer membrane protein [Mariprofundus ferrinatatus]ATX83106.1 Surface antigen variable number repeat-containing protein [Mariprofundus ferrinatatus]